VHGWPSPIRIQTAGGDELEVAFRGSNEGWDVSLTGPAEIAFAGTWGGDGADGAWAPESGAAGTEAGQSSRAARGT
jgi:hypothetical protein